MGWMHSIPSTPCAWWPPAQVQGDFLPWHALSGWVLLSPAFRADLMVVGQCQEEAACCCGGPRAAFALPSSCAHHCSSHHRQLFLYSFCLLKRPLPPLAPQVSLFLNTFFFFLIFFNKSDFSPFAEENVMPFFFTKKRVFFLLLPIKQHIPASSPFQKLLVELC